MGRKWDGTGIAYDKDMWAECLRVLKPGGHMLAFGGCRTFHRMACAIEDAGFEVRDMLEWVYASGFPKSLDISKKLDQMAGAEREVISKERIAPDGHVRRNVACVDKQYGTMSGKITEKSPITAPSSPAAKQWSGYGTALKPAHEPICLARKPLDGCTIAENVLLHGVGGINVDGCRVGYRGETDINRARGRIGEYDKMGVASGKQFLVQFAAPLYKSEVNRAGRFPANLITDGSDAVKALFPETSSKGHYSYKNSKEGVYKLGLNDMPDAGYSQDSGSAARFFAACPFTKEDIPPLIYRAKASRAERENGLEGMPEREKKTLNDYTSPSEGRTAPKSGSPAKNFHPTIKPVKLISYLCRLITPPGGLVLDPFGGSGTTAIAAIQEGFHYILIEQSEEYCEIARHRIAAVPPSLSSFCKPKEAATP